MMQNSMINKYYCDTLVIQGMVVLCYGNKVALL